MLVLGRRPGEKVFIVLPDGRQIEIEVLSNHRGTIRLGFTAPLDIVINRDRPEGKKVATVFGTFPLGG